MKIIVISDSHGNKKAIDLLFNNYKFDYLVHCGDGVSDLGDYIYLDNVFAVSGNCDIFSNEVDERIIELGKKKILITHGHRYGVKRDLDKLIARGKELNCNFIFYGHTHNANYISIDNIYVINPGALQKGKGVIISVDKNISVENISL